MTPRFLVWVTGWGAEPLAEMGTWETEQVWEQVMTSALDMPVGLESS